MNAFSIVSGPDFGLPEVPVAVVLFARLTVFLVVAWAIHAALAGRNPRWRVALWRAIPFGMGVILALAFAPPILEWRIGPANRPVVAGSWPEDSSTRAPVAATPNSIPESIEQVPRRSIGPEISETDGTNLGTELTPSAPRDRAPTYSTRAPLDNLPEGTAAGGLLTRLGLGHWLLVVWAAGTVVLSLRWLLNAGRLSGVINRSRHAPDELVNECGSVAARLGCTADVRVRISAEVQSPCLAGAWRPLLLLPERQWLESARADLPAILCHELAHARGHDLAWNAFLHMISTLLWFHPLVWRVRDAHRAACDAVCDAVAADQVGDVRSYERTLARLALHMTGRRPSFGLAMARKADVRRRIEALDRQVFRSPLPRRLSVPAILMLCVSAVSIGGMGIARAERTREPGRAAASPVTLAASTKADPVDPGAQEATKTAKKPNPVRRHSGPHELRLYTVTIAGRALDRDGRPVADAVIQVVDNNSMTSDDRVLGKTNSGADGGYILRDISIPVLTPPQSAIPKPTESRFEVSGWAPGKAFTWHKTQSYRPEPRPAKADSKDSGQAFYEGETIIADLIFGPSARLSGTVTDDTAKPVSGALVQVGYVNDVRRPDGSGMWHCAAIDPQKGEDLEFNGIASVPAALRSAHTDVHGRYVIEGLPQEAKLLALIDFKPSYAPHSLTIATSTQKFQGVTSVGHQGILNHTLVVPRTVRVRATLAATGKPAVGVTVTARGTKMQRDGSVGKTNAGGMAVLRLQPDNYTLRIEPPSGSDAVVSEQPFTVANEPRERSVDVKLDAGVVVIFEATVEPTGEPIAGVGFEYETDTTRVRKPVHSQTVYVDHPVTGSDGRLRVVMTPGTRRFFPISTRGFEFVPVANALWAPAPGKTNVAKFSFKKAAGSRVMDQEHPKDELIARLNNQWKTQRDLIQRGRARATRYFQSSDGIDPQRLTKLLDSLDPDRVPAIFDLIRKEFPEAEPAAPLAFVVTVDKPRRREEWPAPHPAVRVFNGRESIAYSAENAQVDVTDNSGKSTTGIAIEGIENSFYLGAFGGVITERANGKVTIEKKTTTYSGRRVVDAATGFVYRDSFRYNNGSSATEHWQFAPRPTPQGLVIPAMSIEIHTSGNRTNPIIIRTIESIDLTTPIDPESFVVSVPAGALIIDYRDGPDDTYRGVVRAPVTDVLARADEIAATRKRFVPPVKAGDPAPAIEATVWLNQFGKSEPPKLEGKVVLVDFWGMSCGPCVGQLPEVREAVEHFAGTDLMIIGLHDSSGAVKELAEFAAKRRMTYPLAIDRESKESGWFGVTFAAYGIRGIPSAAVLDRQGKLVFVGEFREAIERAAALLQRD